MSHTDYINTLPAGFAVNASTPHCPCAGMEDAANRLYAVQFHPEASPGPEDTEYLFDRFIASMGGDR